MLQCALGLLAYQLQPSCVSVVATHPLVFFLTLFDLVLLGLYLFLNHHIRKALP